MSVLVYIESPKGHIKKTGYEVASYAVQVAKTLGTDAIALFIGAANDAGSAGKYGVNKVLHANASENQEFDAQVYSKMIADIAKENGANIIIVANTANGKALTGRLAIKMEAGSVSGTNSLPDVSNGFVITKSEYSGKKIVQYNITTKNKVFSLMIFVCAILQ